MQFKIILFYFCSFLSLSPISAAFTAPLHPSSWILIHSARTFFSLQEIQLIFLSVWNCFRKCFLSWWWIWPHSQCLHVQISFRQYHWSCCTGLAHSIAWCCSVHDILSVQFTHTCCWLRVDDRIVALHVNSVSANKLFCTMGGVYDDKRSSGWIRRAILVLPDLSCPVLMWYPKTHQFWMCWHLFRLWLAVFEWILDKLWNI